MPLSKERELEVVRAWNKRYKYERLKRGYPKYLSYQSMFFLGAMAAINDGESFAPWSICILLGRDILDNYKKEELE